MPFIKVRYIVHSTPQPRFTYFTSYTCDRRLSNRKRIITVSKANKRAICEAWQIQDAKARFVTVIYNCVAEIRAGNENYHSSTSPVKHIITMGHVVSYKNPQVWMKVAKTMTGRLKDVQFTWFGNGPLLEEMRKEAKGFNIYFTGTIEDPVPYLQNAAVYYQPSLHETHGIAVIEAMSHHLPCVVSQTGGLPESVENNVNGILVPPEDANQHITAIEKLLTDPALALEYGTKGYEKYKVLFSFEKFKSEMDKIYFS
jgi:glycosyltransferase involved in cell wall biosynthesis